MAKLRKVQVSLGLSIDKNGLWLKPGVGLEIDMDDSETDLGLRKETIQRAFEFASDCLDQEVERLLGE